MASHAALAFRPETPKKARCSCEEKIDALIGALKETDKGTAPRPAEPQAAPMEGVAFGIGAAAGIAVTLLIRKLK